MKISIITVCYNAASTIEDTLASVHGQRHPDVEHIVIDGGSSDNTVQLLQNHEDQLHCWISEPDQGLYDAMNKGIRMASGEIIGFLNADDIYENQQVLTTVAEAFADPELESCYADLVYVDATDLNRVVRYWKSSNYAAGLFGRGWCPPHPTFFVRKRVYAKYGDFDLSYSIGNDVELMMRFLARYQINSLYIPKILVRMRSGGVSNKNLLNVVKQNFEILRAAKNNGLNISPFTFIFAKFISRFRQYQSKGSRVD